MLFPLYVANMVINCLTMKARWREAEKELEMSEIDCDWWISFHDAMRDLDALEIAMDSRAHDGQLPASRRARLRREEGGVRLARRRD